MTQKQEDTEQDAKPVQPEAEEQKTTGEVDTVSDDDVKDDGTGTHGRPSDDSDPGHS